MRMISWEEMQALDEIVVYFWATPLQLMENLQRRSGQGARHLSPGKRIAIVAGGQ